MFFKNGDKFTGDFSEDLFHGRGEMRFGNLNTYRGEFLNGRMEGKGKMKYKVQERLSSFINEKPDAFLIREATSTLAVGTTGPRVVVARSSTGMETSTPESGTGITERLKRIS